MKIYKVYCAETDEEFYYASKPSTSKLVRLAKSLDVDKFEDETFSHFVKDIFEITTISVRK